MTSRTFIDTPYFADDRVVSLSNFIAQHLTDPHIEIQAKLGSFKTDQQARIFSNTSIIPDRMFPFQSQVSKPRFDCIKQLISKSRFDHMQSSTTQDTFYNTTQNQKLRQTSTLQGEVIQTIKKTRIRNMNVLINAISGLGFRISANYEQKLRDIPQGSTVSMIRTKKRQSFFFSYFRVDFTQVTTGKKTTYEIQIEISDPVFVIRYVEAFQQGIDKGSLVGIANKFWNNIISLSFIQPRTILPQFQQDQTFLAERSLYYQQYWGQGVPVIGDYFYCVAQERASKEFMITQIRCLFENPELILINKRPPKASGAIPKHTLLKLMNQSRGTDIQLDDMVSYNQKSLLKRLPNRTRSICQEVFRNFIFSYKSFSLPVDTFYELYLEAISSFTPKKGVNSNRKKKDQGSSLDRPSIIDEVQEEEEQEQFLSFEDNPQYSDSYNIHSEEGFFTNSGPPTILQTMCQELTPKSQVDQKKRRSCNQSLEAPRPMSAKKTRFKHRISSPRKPRPEQSLNDSSNRSSIANRSIRKFSQPSVFKNIRSLSRERTFIKYDQEFIGSVKQTTESRPSVLRSHTPKPVRKSPQQTQNPSNSSYKSIKKKREQIKNSIGSKSVSKKTKKSFKAPKNSSTFKKIYKNSEELIKIRQKHLKYSLRN